MTVKELIEELKKYPENMEVLDSAWLDIEGVAEMTWTHNNPPYDKPDKQVVVIQ